jgi:transcription termination factor Rho
MPEMTNGVMKRTKKGGFVLRDPARSFRANDREVMVPARWVQKYRLVEGAALEGPVRKTKKGLELAEIRLVSGGPPRDFQHRSLLSDLVAIDPCERFNLSITGEKSMRIVDLVAPIGKGTRGMIVSPPKAGKTILLEHIANSIHECDPDTRIIVLLIDERPEEVTHFKRAVQAEVLASSNDQSVEDHVELAELTLAHIRTELECGKDVVVLLDSLTRMGRAFNLKGTGNRGRTMSGGVEAGALEIPRRFFGSARNIENGGSITIIATALIETGSRMDQLIFEEFKGTGNSEIILDRKLAESYIFPAINLPASGTRKEDRLYDPGTGPRITKLRRVLAGRKPQEAMSALLKLLDEFPTNEKFLQSIPVGG